MNYLALFGLDVLMAFLLIIVWAVARSKAGRLARSASLAQLRRRAKGTQIAFGLALLPTAGKMAIMLMLQEERGWIFTQDKWLFHLPVLLLSTLAAIVFSVPRLRALAVLASAGDGDGPPTADHRKLAADPYLTLPFDAALLGSIACLYFLLAPPMLSHWERGAWPIAILIIVLLLLGFRQVRRQREWSAANAVIRRPFAQRLASFGIGLLVIAVAGTVWYTAASADSRLPDRLSMMEGAMDYGGGQDAAQDHHEVHQPSGISVTELTGPREGEPDRRFTLTAMKKTIELDSGETMEAWTFNGQLPGPELRMRQGELIEVKLINQDIDEGVTLHWHGLDVPNAEDGVAGATQDAVMPGQTHTYRFIAGQSGTYWYHTHQASAEGVRKGLFGSLIVDPADAPSKPEGLDMTVMTHIWEKGGLAFDASRLKLEHIDAEPGTKVRLRLINTDNWLQQKFAIVGAPFQVAAIDGTAVNGPTDLTNTVLDITTGGRYDVTFTMPGNPVFLGIGENLDQGMGILFGQGDGGAVPSVPAGELFDPSVYGSPQPLPFDLDTAYDREFTMILDNSFGFYDGGFNQLYTINGEVFPNTPMYMVKEGDLVKTTIVNRGMVEHPMHLHGHHMLVLSRNGQPVSGSPWWSDTLYVGPGETYVVAFKADNPGVWMDHCHNLDHAAIGMTMHLAYEGVWSPFEIGSKTVNHPE